MRFLILAVFACGAKPPAQQAQQPMAIVVEWKVAAAADDRVDVTLVVDDSPIAIGSLSARNEDTVGPATCALRSAHAQGSELVCGDTNGYVVDLVGSELVIARVEGDQRSEVKRVPVAGDGLVVKALALPLDPTGR